MANDKNTPRNERDMTNNRLESFSSIPGDLPTSPKDNKELEAEETTIDLPEVKDIPGQEFVHVPHVGEMADTTASSADEEGNDVFGVEGGSVTGNDDEDLIQGASNVRPDERQALEDETYMPTRDADRLRDARMDNTDFQGEELNEESFGVAQMLDPSGLDTDTAPMDTETTSLGQGDEENQEFTQSDTDTNQPNENRTGA